jgi:hypothetical protein
MVHVLTVIGYVVITFVVQGSSHLAINQAHYAEIPFTRADPIIPLALAALLIQGSVMSYIHTRLTDGTLAGALRTSWLLGAFLLSYIALAQPGDFQAPSILSWTLTEAWVSAIQFTLIGIMLWFVHGRFGAARMAAA